MNRNQIGYLPRSIADELDHLSRLTLSDENTLWKVRRIVERGFAEGYDEGYVRGFHEGWNAGNEQAEKRVGTLREALGLDQDQTFDADIIDAIQSLRGTQSQPAEEEM